MMLSLAILVITKNIAILPGVAIGKTITVLGILTFIWNVLRNLKE